MLRSICRDHVEWSASGYIGHHISCGVIPLACPWLVFSNTAIFSARISWYENKLHYLEANARFAKTGMTSVAFPGIRDLRVAGRGPSSLREVAWLVSPLVNRKS